MRFADSDPFANSDMNKSPQFSSPQFSLSSATTVIDWHIGAQAPTIPAPLAAAIGNFDGVHRGHQHLIASTKQAKGLTPAVITFAPHPRWYFNPDQEGFSLADEQDKTAFLAASGAEVIIRLVFDEAMRQTSADDFISVVLPALGVSKLYAGADFAFGTGRKGDMALIKRHTAHTGIEAISVDIVEQDGTAISSSRIRSVLKSGDVGLAAQLIGHPYTMSGTVITGDKRGRSIGFPTANIAVEQMQLPAFGVYAVAVRCADMPNCPIVAGIANIGRRPTVADRGVLLEAHLFDNDSDLYGQRLNVMLLDFIRPERAFDSIDELTKQISEDVGVAKAYHAATMGLLLDGDKETKTEIDK